MLYRFDSFSLSQQLGRLDGPVGEIHLRPQVFQVLLILAEEAPRIVSGDELMDRVWGATFTTAASVRQTLSELRRALGDDPHAPRYIETVHRRGYRMIAPLERLPEDDRLAQDLPEISRTTWRQPWEQALVAVGIIALLLFSIVHLQRPAQSQGAVDHRRPQSLISRLDSNLKGLSLLNESRALIRRADYRGALPLLQRAVEVDPYNLRHRETLTAVYENLGLKGLAAQEAARVLQLPVDLSLEEELLRSAHRYKMRGDFTRAEANLQTLYEHSPDDVDYGLQLTSVLIKAGRQGEALELAQDLNRRVASHDIRATLLELKVLVIRFHLPEAERLARRLIVTSPEDPSSLEVTTTGLRQLFTIHLRRGELEEARDTLSQLENIPSHLQGSSHRAYVSAGRAELLGLQGHLEASVSRFREAAERFQRLGDTGAKAGTLNRLAYLLDSSGLSMDAAACLEQAIALNRPIGNIRGLAVSLSLMAAVQADLGDLPQARQVLDEALLLNETMDDPRRQALVLHSLAKVLMTEGQLEDAELNFLESLELSDKIGDRTLATAARHGLGMVATLRDRPEEARQLLNQAASQFDNLGNLPHFLGTQLQLAKIAQAAADPEASQQILSNVLQRTQGTTLFHYADIAQTGLAGLGAKKTIY